MPEDVKISIVLNLPRGHYQVAEALSQIQDYANLDKYVSDTIKENVEMLLDGIEPLCDSVYRRLTGNPHQSSLELTSITKQLGPIAQVDVKLTLPLAFLEYIKEVAIRKNRETETSDQYCSRRCYER